MANTDIPGLFVDLEREKENYYEYVLDTDGLAYFRGLLGQQVSWDGPSVWEDGPCFGNAGAWDIIEKLSEHVHQHYKTPICEAKAVFGCRKVSGDGVGQEGIIKVFLQLPPLDTAHGHVLHDFGPDSDDPSNYDNELYNLVRLTEARCPVAPKLWHWEWTTRTQDDPTPDGYRGMILMQRIPGKNLENFWDMPLEKRDLIREVFKKSYPLIMPFFFLKDHARRNLIWVESEEKLYFIEFERTGKPIVAPEVTDIHLDLWDLQLTIYYTGKVFK